VEKHLKVGQEVNVKVLGVDEKGRINLSIKQAVPKEQRPPVKPLDPTGRTVRGPVEVSFEDKLKLFMQDSDSKISGLYSDRRVSRRKNRQ
jgi:S1 RNA binding domain protein